MYVRARVCVGVVHTHVIPIADQYVCLSANMFYNGCTFYGVGECGLGLQRGERERGIRTPLGPIVRRLLTFPGETA